MKVQAILFATLLRARPALPSGLGAVASDVSDVDAALLDCALPCEKANLRASESKWRACLEANCGERRPINGEIGFDAAEEKKDAEDVSGNPVVEGEKKKKKKKGNKSQVEDLTPDKKKKKKKGHKSQVVDVTPEEKKKKKKKCSGCDGRNQNKKEDAFDEDPEIIPNGKVIDRAPSKGKDKKKKKKGEDVSDSGVVDRVGKDKKKKKAPKDQTTDKKKKKRSDGGSSKCDQCNMIRVRKSHCMRENCPHLLDQDGRIPEEYVREFGLEGDEVEGTAGGGVEGAEEVEVYTPPGHCTCVQRCRVGNSEHACRRMRGCTVCPGDGDDASEEGDGGVELSAA